MRLLHSKSYQLELLHNPSISYAIVSHRWGPESEEVLFGDIGDEARTKNKGIGYEKIKGACTQAIRDGLNYVWLDTCCIDKSNSTELCEAINSMYKWYGKSNICYAYLHDVNDRSDFEKSEWFSRGWTLQELIAPKTLKFFTKDWQFLGTREDLMESILQVTGICPEVLRSPNSLQEVTISQRMCWAAKRQTTKIEDRAYSLLGIFKISLVPIYGSDDGAFEELQFKLIMKYSDQTIFSWYHTYTPPEDVEMAVALDHITAPTVPSISPSAGASVEAVNETSVSVPASVSASEPVENDDTFLCNETGLLATSPSHYLKAYEITEQDFRKNYTDGIGDIKYRSNFSILNNFVRILVPVKYVSGKIWKAVLRCSFEPPGDSEGQRPLVIYLKQLDHWKYVRVHLAPDGEAGGKEGDIPMDEVPGVRGSLERLSDSEVQLEGYHLREIDVRAGYERSPEDKPQQASYDPDTLPEPTETERIAQLPRHPPGTNTTNIVVCGEPGVGAGRTINLIIGSTIIKPLTDYERETMAVTIIDGTLQSRQVRFFYIIGPRDPCLDCDIYYTALRNMYQLVHEIKKAGGIHLVLLCMVGSKVTPAVQSNYRLFADHVCQKRVPKILVVTGLGRTRRMEDWWDKHKNDRELQRMGFIGHACITVLQGQGGGGSRGDADGNEDDEDDRDHENKYKESAKKLRDLLIAFMDGPITSDEATNATPAVGKPEAYCPEDAKQWFIDMGKGSMDLLLRGLKNSLTEEAVLKMLKENTKLDEREAIDLAGRFFDRHAMEL